METKSLLESTSYEHPESGADAPPNPGAGKDVGGQRKLNKALSWAEELFCRYVSQDLSLTEAYRRAYPSAASWTAKSVTDEASRKAKSERIKGRIAVLREKIAQQSANQCAITAVQMREHVRMRLYAESNEAEKASDRIRALQLLGTLPDVALFGSDRVDAVRAGQDSADIEGQLRMALEKAFKPALELRKGEDGTFTAPMDANAAEGEPMPLVGITEPDESTLQGCAENVQDNPATSDNGSAGTQGGQIDNSTAQETA